MGNHSDSNWYMYLLWQPIISAIFYLWGYLAMMFLDVQIDLVTAIIGAAAVIAGALITGVITLIIQGIQLKRDGKKIEATQAIASDMKPKVESINKQTEKLDMLYADLDHRKRLEASNPHGVSAREALLSSAQALLEQNAQLAKQYNLLLLDYQQAQAEITALKEEIHELRQQKIPDPPRPQLDFQR